MKSNPRAKALILEVIENQLQANDPPETKQTLERLISDGYSENEAKEFIACVVSSEMFEMLKKRQPFNPKRFIKGLHKLPKLPWD